MDRTVALILSRVSALCTLPGPAQGLADKQALVRHAQQARQHGLLFGNGVRALFCRAQGLGPDQQLAIMRLLHAQQAQRDAMQRVQQQQAAQAQHAPNQAQPGQPGLLQHFGAQGGYGGGQAGHMAPSLAQAQAQHQAQLRAAQQARAPQPCLFLSRVSSVAVVKFVCVLRRLIACMPM